MMSGTAARQPAASQAQSSCRCRQRHLSGSLTRQCPPLGVGNAAVTAGHRWRQHSSIVSAHQVEITHDAGVTVLEVEDGVTILEAALDSGLELSHDCKMGVCMTCPAKLESGQVDQSAGMLDDDVKDKGYALLCVSTPQSDCRVRTIEEDELLEQVLHGG